MFSPKTVVMEHLAKSFPKTSQNNKAVIGNIPIAFFDQYEDEIRREMRYHGLMVIYRGPRACNKNNWMRTATKRENAVSVLLYPNTRR